MRTKQSALLQQVEALIERYGKDDSELNADLHALRDDLKASSIPTPGDFALFALRVATWAKWIHDHLP